MQETLGNRRNDAASSSTPPAQTGRTQLIEDGIAQTLTELDTDSDHAHAPGRRPIDFGDDLEPAQLTGEDPGTSRGRRSPIRHDAARPIVAVLAAVAVGCLALLGIAIAQGYIP